MIATFALSPATELVADDMGRKSCGDVPTESYFGSFEATFTTATSCSLPMGVLAASSFGVTDEPARPPPSFLTSPGRKKLAGLTPTEQPQNTLGNTSKAAAIDFLSPTPQFFTSRS